MASECGFHLSKHSRRAGRRRALAGACNWFNRCWKLRPDIYLRPFNKPSERVSERANDTRHCWLFSVFWCFCCMAPKCHLVSTNWWTPLLHAPPLPAPICSLNRRLLLHFSVIKSVVFIKEPSTMMFSNLMDTNVMRSHLPTAAVQTRSLLRAHVPGSAASSSVATPKCRSISMPASQANVQPYWTPRAVPTKFTKNYQSFFLQCVGILIITWAQIGFH